MKVKELIKDLEEYNPEADVTIVSDYVELPYFFVTYAGVDGGSKKDMQCCSFFRRINKMRKILKNKIWR